MSLETQGKLFTVSPNRLKAQAVYYQCIVAQSKQAIATGAKWRLMKKRLEGKARLKLGKANTEC